MDKCGICQKPASQLFETGNEVLYACFKCQPLVPEVTINDSTEQINVTATEAAPQGGEEGATGEGAALYCGICHKSFARSVQLQNHLRNHRAERRFVCTYCNKAFSQSNNLRAHLRIHTNERPYKCSECGKAFTQVTNLNNHVRLHTGERPYACPEPGCSMAYAQVTNLNQHRKRHATGRAGGGGGGGGKEPHECPVCGEHFLQRNHMYSHRRLAHGGGAGAGAGGEAKGAARGRAGRGGRACQLCGEQFASERQLQQHVDEHACGQQHRDMLAYACVFSVCAMRFASPREHTEHLLRAHQLRVLAAPAPHRPPPRRGRPPKNTKAVDPLELKENAAYDEDLFRNALRLLAQCSQCPEIRSDITFSILPQYPL